MKPLNLRIPGPTPLPLAVLKALSTQMINHRGKLYESIQKQILSDLQHFFGTENEIYLLTSSGMGGLEASLVNFFALGDRVLFLTCGEFGNRWAEIGKRYNLDVTHIKEPVGTGFNREKVIRH